MIEVGIAVVLTTFFNVLMMKIIANVIIKTSNKETTEFSPIEKVRQFNERREREIEQDRTKVISENIDAYNGTPEGQQDIPR